jgi:hypothetical protein
MVHAAIRLFSSLKLTVSLLAVLALLTWLGTLAQVEDGLYHVQKDYFESLVVLARTPIPVPWADRNLVLPLPGAYLVLAVLFVNLLVGGVVRLRRDWRNGGILAVHLGILLLLLAGFVKLNFSHAGHQALFEGRQGAQFVSFHDWELALLRMEGDMVVERTLPAARIAWARPGRPAPVATEGLPFRLEIDHYLANCEARRKAAMSEVPVPVLDGVFLQELPYVKQTVEANEPGCYVTVIDAATGARTRGILHGRELRPFDMRRFPFTFEAGGAIWGLDLRRVTWDLPFTVRLDRFVKRDHPGTRMPREFSSYVTVIEGDAERQVHITMNAPLRQGGYVFYQSNWGPQQGGGPPWYSVFEVSRNPSDRWEILACTIIALGLGVHFVRKLSLHIKAERSRAEAGRAA